MIDLDAIAARDHAWNGESQTATSPEADRRALLEHITELETITEQILQDFRAVKALVQARTTFDPGPDPPLIARNEYQNQWSKDNRIRPAQWRMLEELSEPNKNPENEWSFPHKALRTGRRLVELGLAKEHDYNTHRCVFSITDAGRTRLALRKNPHGKVDQRFARGHRVHN